MSKVQDTIHRFVIDAAIVTGCVCVIAATQCAIRTGDSVREVVKETKTLIAQRDERGVLVGGLAHEVNRLIQRGGKLVEEGEKMAAQLRGKDASADGVVGQLVQAMIHFNNLLAQINGSKSVDAGMVAQFRSTVERLNDVISNANSVVAQMGNHTVVLTDDNRDKLLGSIDRMLRCYNGYKNSDNTKNSIDGKLFGNNTEHEISLMAALCDMLQSEEHRAKDFHIMAEVSRELNSAVASINDWVRHNQGAEFNSENMEEFSRVFKDFNKSLNSFVKTAAITEKGKYPELFKAAARIDDVLSRFRGRTFVGGLFASPDKVS